MLAAIFVICFIAAEAYTDDEWLLIYDASCGDVRI